MRFRALWVVVAALGIGVGIGSRAHAQANTPIKLGVVDLAKVFKGYKKSAELEERINAERDELKAELDAIKKTISDLNKELDLLDFGSETYQKKEEEKARAVGLYELKKRRLEDRIKRRWEEYNVALLDDINAVVADYGKKNGYTLIFKVDAEPNKDQKLLAGLRNVLYFTETIDITGDIVTILNRRYEMEGGVTPGRKPAAGKGGR